jgi:hypothetical protein
MSEYSRYKTESNVEGGGEEQTKVTDVGESSDADRGSERTNRNKENNVRHTGALYAAQKPI